MRYLEGGYYDQNGKIKKEIYIDWAKEQADLLAAKEMTKASMRRFYTQLKALQPLINNEASFENHKQKIYPLLPLVNYASNKQEGKVPYEFKQFIEKNVELALLNYKNFYAFIEHFQSVVAYFKEPGGFNNQQRNHSNKPFNKQHNKPFNKQGERR